MLAMQDPCRPWSSCCVRRPRHVPRDSTGVHGTLSVVVDMLMVMVDLLDGRKLVTHPLALKLIEALVRRNAHACGQERILHCQWRVVIDG